MVVCVNFYASGKKRGKGRAKHKRKKREGATNVE